MNFEQLVTLFQFTHEEIKNRAVRAADLSLVVRNWLFGRYIIEFEQNGADRAAYGASLVDVLTERLKMLGIQGVSATRLRLYRSFYRIYQGVDRQVFDESIVGTQSGRIQPTPSDESSPTIHALPIQPTLSGEFAPWENNPRALSETVLVLSRRFPLGWSHYVELLTIDSPEERRFYEIEATTNQWSVRELQRQIASSLYERLALSRDKDEVRRLAKQGQVVEKAADLVKNPLVLEFLGLEDRPHGF
jgi:hypothetical protein